MLYSTLLQLNYNSFEVLKAVEYLSVDNKLIVVEISLLTGYGTFNHLLVYCLRTSGINRVCKRQSHRKIILLDLTNDRS